MIRELSENQTLLSFFNMIPYFEKFMQCDLGFTISNTEYFLHAEYSDSFKRETKDLSRMPKKGDKIPPNSAADVCLKKQDVVYVNVPEEVFGIPVKTIAVPVWVDGKIEGTMVLAMNTKRQKEMSSMANILFETLSQISVDATNMAARFEEINATNIGIEKFTDETNDRAKKTDEILGFVNNITRKTNLLGINASIESARVGEVGKGFGVVAQEISKLSQSTKQSVDEINQVIGEIQNNIHEIGTKFNDSNKLMEAQINELVDIAEHIQKLNEVATQLNEYASKI